MMRLEILNQNDEILSSHKLSDDLTLIGQSPGAHVLIKGQGIGGLHLAIRSGEKPVIMDLGGPTRLKINGKEAVEQTVDGESTLIEIGSRRLRLVQMKNTLPKLQEQKWEPVSTEKNQTLTIRVRLYFKGIPQNVTNNTSKFILDPHYGLAKPFEMVTLRGGKAYAKLPQEWISLGGRIRQAGKDSITPLTDWANEVELQPSTIYRVYAGAYQVEILISKGQMIIGAGRPDLFPKDLRKPFSLSLASVLIMFGLWMFLFGRPDPKVEEPYTTYARIQNIPVEKIFEPEPNNEPSAGGGAGSESKQTTAPQTGAAQAAPSKLAMALTGGLKNLVGGLVSNSKSNTNTIVSETGLGAAAAAGGAATQTGKLAAVGQGVGAIAGATKLGKLALAGSGQGFSGGSGTGLGTGSGTGIGTGVGDGIGRGSFRLVEEESIVDGGLDKSVIAAVIQNNLSQIKYCYERQLVAEPDLFGKVVVAWTINGNGAVESQNIKQTTLSSNPVENCMLAKIGGWQFPKPKNGSKVSVSYPFLFKSTK